MEHEIDWDQALGIVPKYLKKWLREMEIRGRIKILLTKMLLRSAWILWRVLENWGLFLSFGMSQKRNVRGYTKNRGIPGRYFCRRSFATWDVLLPSEDLAKRLTGNITAKLFWLQPECRDQRRIKVTVCNVSMQLNGDVLAAYLCSCSGVEDCTQITSTSGTAYGDYSFTMSLDRVGFQAIPQTITDRDQTMMLVVDGSSWIFLHVSALKKWPLLLRKRPLLQPLIQQQRLQK